MNKTAYIQNTLLFVSQVLLNQVSSHYKLNLIVKALLTLHNRMLAQWNVTSGRQYYGIKNFM